jgi:hypothetical protein
MQIPHALEPRARLILEASGWAIDSILISLADLAAVASAMPLTEPSIELEHRLFVHCWSIVDQCHMLRSVLQRLPPTAHKDIDMFVEKTEKFTLLRNSMDHLSEKLDNLVKAKVAMPPIFGAVSWIRVDAENILDDRITGYTVWNVSSGTVLHKPEWTVLHPASELAASEAVSNFVFEAFDHCVDLSALAADIGLLLDHFEQVVKPRVESNIREGAKSHGIDPEEALKMRGSGGLKIGFKIVRK